MNQYSVVIPVFNNFKVARECVVNVLKKTPMGTPIFVIDDASTDGFFSDYIYEFIDQVKLIRNNKNLGFVGASNLGFEVTAPNDVILVNSDVMVVKHWSERLHMDAYRLDLIATVTAMADRGGIASVKIGEKDLRGCHLSEIESLSEYLFSLAKLPPAVIPVGVGHCLYVRREALTTIGFFSEEFSPGYGEEVDFSLRAAKAGFTHILSNSVIVLHQEGLSFGSRRNALIEKHETLLREKYPDFDQYLVSHDQSFKNVEAIFSRAITKKYGV